MTLIAFAILFSAVLGGCLFNRMTADRLRAGGARLHSLSGFHEIHAALVVGLPGLVPLVVWLAQQGPATGGLMMSGLPQGMLDGLAPGQVALVQSEIIPIANGNIFGTPAAWKVDAANRLVALDRTATWLMVAALALLVLAALGHARARVSDTFRASRGRILRSGPDDRLFHHRRLHDGRDRVVAGL
jgi:phosphate transport system permease protein